jgi:hypothetical protein
MIAMIFAQRISAQETPEWAKDLIVYEVATRGFTSPNGPESGSFKSAQEKLPYLEKLGITGIWLTGTNLGDPKHFYNIWTQYACVDPAKLDPSLGTPEDFKALIDDAHRRGIKVFMDVITHGVMNNSPLIKEHPDWFRGSTWGMTDFDWNGKHKDLDEWWVKTFTDWVTEYGVDGYRLDVDIYRPDLWKRIKQNAAAAGHPIVVFNENWIYSEEFGDFLQRMTTLSTQKGGADMNVLLHRDVVKHYQQFDYFRIVELSIQYTDKSTDRGYLDVKPFLGGDIYGYADSNPKGALKLTLLNSPAPPTPEKQEPQRLLIEGVNPGKVIRNVSIRPFGWTLRYNYGVQGSLLSGFTGSARYEMEITPFVPDRLLYSTQLSSHDNGWDGTPLDKNPYVAKGSRSMFGYSFLFAPSIPLFMSGEEFNADYVPLPAHTPGLYGKGEPGTGRWLYASMIDWEQLKQPAKKDMLDDVTRMIAIRKADADLFRPVTTDKKPPIKAVSLQATGIDSNSVPAPYMLYNDSKAIVVCGNTTDKTVKGFLNISLAGTPLENFSELQITDLWNGGKPKRIKAADLQKFPVVMKPDRTKRGGVAVFKIELTVNADNDKKTVGNDIRLSSSPNDLAFNSLATLWDEAVPPGNAIVGSLVWQKGDALRMSLDHVGLWDLRQMVNGDSLSSYNFKWVESQVLKKDYCPVQLRYDVPYDTVFPAKIPGGALEFDLKTLGKADSVRIYLRNAVCEARWNGGARLQTFVHAAENAGWFRFDTVSGLSK